MGQRRSRRRRSRNRMTRVYRTSGTSAVSMFRPTIGTRAANSARLGIVYTSPAPSENGDVQPPAAGGGQAEREGDDEAHDDRDARQVEVLARPVQQRRDVIGEPGPVDHGQARAAAAPDPSVSRAHPGGRRRRRCRTSRRPSRRSRCQRRRAIAVHEHAGLDVRVEGMDSASFSVRAAIELRRHRHRGRQCSVPRSGMRVLVEPADRPVLVVDEQQVREGIGEDAGPRRAGRVAGSRGDRPAATAARPPWRATGA